MVTSNRPSCTPLLYGGTSRNSFCATTYSPSTAFSVSFRNPYSLPLAIRWIPIPLGIFLILSGIPRLILVRMERELAGDRVFEITALFPNKVFAFNSPTRITACDRIR